MNNKSLVALVAAIMVGLVGVSSLVRAYMGPPPKVVVEGNYIEASGEKQLGGTTNLDDLSLTSVTITGTSTLTGAITASGGLTSSGDTRATSLVRTGSIATFTVTSTASAANVCDNPHWIVTPVTTTPTITLPATSTLFADCLTTNGDVVEFSIASVTTSTIVGIGTGGNLDLGTTATITADKSAIVRIIRDSASTYLAILRNANS